MMLIFVSITFKRCSATSRFIINSKSIHNRNSLKVFLSVCSVHAARVLSLVGINRSCLRFAWEGSKSAFQPTYVFLKGGGDIFMLTQYIIFIHNSADIIHLLQNKIIWIKWNKISLIIFSFSHATKFRKNHYCNH